jgi:hypothetical protein
VYSHAINIIFDLFHTLSNNIKFVVQNDIILGRASLYIILTNSFNIIR